MEGFGRRQALGFIGARPVARSGCPVASHSDADFVHARFVTISRTTGIYALLFSGLSRRKGERGEICVTHIECFRTQ
jgi:hypothetical protein